MTDRDDLACALGQLAQNFALLETHLSFLVWSLIGNDQAIGHIMTAGLAFPALTDKFFALASHKLPNSEPQLQVAQLRKELHQANDTRNRFLHSTWTAGDEPDTSAGIRLRLKNGSVDFNFAHVKPSEVSEAAKDFGELASRLMKFYMDIGGAIVADNPPH